jgi:hypothetical protein
VRNILEARESVNRSLETTARFGVGNFLLARISFCDDVFVSFRASLSADAAIASSSSCDSRSFISCCCCMIYRTKVQQHTNVRSEAQHTTRASVHHCVSGTTHTRSSTSSPPPPSCRFIILISAISCNISILWSFSARNGSVSSSIAVGRASGSFCRHRAMNALNSGEYCTATESERARESSAVVGRSSNDASTLPSLDV